MSELKPAQASKAIYCTVSFDEVWAPAHTVPDGEKRSDIDAAGSSIESILEKVEHYRTWTYEQFEEVLQYNREEVRALYSGDPPDPLIEET